jgi:hypothetical protein
MPPWPTLIVFAVLGSSAVVIVAGYFLGNRKGRAVAPGNRKGRAVAPGNRKRRAVAGRPPAARGSVPPGWDQKAAHTDSWIWR